jgi:hypothetical protein
METATSVGNIFRSYISVTHKTMVQFDQLDSSNFRFTMYKADEARQFSKDAFRNVYYIEIHPPYYFTVLDSIIYDCRMHSETLVHISHNLLGI